MIFHRNDPTKITGLQLDSAYETYRLGRPGLYANRPARPRWRCRIPLAFVQSRTRRPHTCSRSIQTCHHTHRVLPPTKQPYPYGWFGPQPTPQWKRSFGSSKAHTQWSRM